MLRIALVDDHPIFREGMRTLLSRQPGITVVGEAADAKQAYKLVAANKPDVVVVDVNLPGVDGITATRELCRRAPEGKLLVLSVHEDQSCAAQALEAGALGYAFKSQPAEAVVAAIRTVGRGERYLPPDLATISFESRESNGDPIGLLSPRECDVFRLLVRGFTNQGVANELYISVKTVETHRARIHRKLELHSVAELIRFAARNQLLLD